MKRNIYVNLFVACVVFFTIAVIVPGNSTLDFSSFIVFGVLIVAVFTFGMMLAYSVSNRQSRLDKIREQLREQDAILLNIYDLSKAFGDETLAQVREKIDLCLQAQIDYQLRDFERSHKEVRSLCLYLMQLKTKTKNQEEAKSKLLDEAGELIRIHKRVCYNVQNKMMPYEWFSLIVLGCIILFSLYHENQNTWISIVIVTIVSGALVLFLLILKELDSLQWQERAWIWEPLTVLFLDLGLLPYFPEDIFMTKRLKLRDIRTPDGVTRIRVAHYPKPYPDNTDKRIDIVDLQKTA